MPERSFVFRISAAALFMAVSSAGALQAKLHNSSMGHKHNVRIEHQLGPLREEVNALRQEVAAIEAEQANSEPSEINTLRIAVVVMGVGMAGGLLRLRKLGEQVKQLKDQQ